MTTNGTVWQTHGTTTGATFVWIEAWTAQSPIPALRSHPGKEFKGDLAFSGEPNRLPRTLKRS
ncbi:hypothetical protein ACFV14_37985 [Streptomyces zaomyceticus]|uniref:hypothetical protein n=1 Tax=Streptomyces zaomyceticus TaxID=68286 RepID=UPI0036882CF7